MGNTLRFLVGVTSAGEAAVFLGAAGFVRAAAGALLGLADFTGPPAGDVVVLFPDLAAAGDADFALLGAGDADFALAGDDAAVFAFLLAVAVTGGLVGVGGLLLRICLITGDTEGRVVAYKVTYAPACMSV